MVCLDKLSRRDMKKESENFCLDKLSRQDWKKERIFCIWNMAVGGCFVGTDRLVCVGM
jgi:hypothetical protein